MMKKILVCPVAYNENVKLKNAIERFLNAGLSQPCDYLIVDDSSDDGTSEMIRSYASKGVRTLRHSRRRGVGAAIRTAIKYAAENHYDVIVIMAGNDKDDPKEIPLLLGPIINGDYEFVQGSRYLSGGGTGGDMPFYRKIATRLHPCLMSLITGRRVTDSTNGFRAMKIPLFQNNFINLDQDWLDTYELEPYILYHVIKSGRRFKEVPVTKIYPAKKLGYTKMKPVIGWWSILKPLVYLGLGIKK